jgi:predicted RNA-binding protein YlqC (UPF0109 family)
MKELLEYVARHLVDNPDQVEVTVKEGEKSLIMELQVAPEDTGKVIGRNGRIINAIRTLIKAAAIKKGYTNTIVDVKD